MTHGEFEAGYRKLCSAFGISFNESRSKVYAEKFEHMDVFAWMRLVNRWISIGGSFPKVSDLMEQPEYVKSLEADDERDSLERWIYSDCRVAECIDGLIPVGVIGAEKTPIFAPDALKGMTFEHEISYLCPKCKRAVPSVSEKTPTWEGPITIRSMEEMAARILERKDVAKNLKERGVA